MNEESISRLKLANVSHLDDILSVYGNKGFLIVDSKFNKLIDIKSGPGDSLVNRWDLHKSLLEKLDVHYDKNFIRYEENENSIIAYFEDGTSVEGDILIGADGNHSNVRKQFSSELKVDYIDYASIAGSFTKVMDKKYDNLYNMIQKRLVRVLGPEGLSVLLLDFKGNDGFTHIIWSMSFPYKKDPSDIPFEELIKKGYAINDIIGDMVKASGKTILSRRMRSTDTSKKVVLQSKKVALLGDAAHTMTTQRGLGANTAILDAYDLYIALKGKNWEESLAKYHTIMIARGFKAVNDSLMSTNMIHMSGFKAIIRNYIIWTIDKVIALRSYFSSWFKKN